MVMAIPPPRDSPVLLLSIHICGGTGRELREVNGPFVQLLLNSDEASEARCTRYVAELRIETVDAICELMLISVDGIDGLPERETSRGNGLG